MSGTSRTSSREQRPTNVASDAASHSWDAWLQSQERRRAQIMLMLLIPVSAAFLITDLRLEEPARSLNMGLRLGYVVLMVVALVAWWRSWQPVAVKWWSSVAALGIALFCCVRYGFGYGTEGIPGHLATDVLIILAIYTVPLPTLVQVLVSLLVAVASAYGYLVWQGVGGAGALLLLATLMLAHALGLGGSIALRHGLRQRYDALLELHDHMIELDRAETALERLAYYDTLTGLPNRALLMDRLEQLIARLERHGGKFALFYIDLDRFKFVNDTLGHAAGDLVLGQAARRMHEVLRRSDTLARLGGDEFVLIIEDANAVRDLDVVAEKIIDAMQQVFHVESREIFINASIGISLYPDDGTDVATLTRNADVAMYRAKQAGRGRFMFYAAAMNQENDRRMSMESALRRGIERGEFLLHYQPRMELRSGRIRGFEALLRWCKPDEGLVSPGEFIPLAEETGLIVPLGYWVIERACRQLRTWHDQGYRDIGIAINLSARQFQDQRLAERIAAVLRELALPAECVEFELTESILMGNADWSLQQIDRLSALGVTIAIDDFGVGYSSLGYLKRFPISALKIDRTFVQDIVEDPEDAAIVRAVISLGEALQIKVVAEGIETEAQHEFLVAHGCEEGQGYLYGRPGTPDEAARFLQRELLAMPLERTPRLATVSA